MTNIRDLHQQWSKDPQYIAEFNNLSAEFELATSLIETRNNAGLTQEELAERMNTTQSSIARMESGKKLPSANTLKRFAQATGTKLKISFEASLPTALPTAP